MINGREVYKVWIDNPNDITPEQYMAMLSEEKFREHFCKTAGMSIDKLRTLSNNYIRFSKSDDPHISGDLRKQAMAFIWVPYKKGLHKD